MPVVTSENYWNILFTELQKDVEENGKSKYFLIEKDYKKAIDHIEERIRFFYGKHSTDNCIPLKQAYKKLDKEHLEQFRELIKECITWWDKETQREEKVSEKDTSETDVINDTETWINTLHEYQEKEDITYFEALSVPIINEVEKVSNETSNHLLELLVITGWMVHHDISKNLKIKGLAQDTLNKEFLKSWAADNMDLYSRFNANKAKLSATVKGALVKGFKNELSVDEVVAEVSKVMGVGEGVAKRLVLTENAFFNTHSTYLALKQAGYTHYRYVCRLLPTSCDDCIELHGSIFPIEMYESGVTSPPLHPNCLCYISGEVI